MSNVEIQELNEWTLDLDVADDHLLTRFNKYSEDCS